MGDGGVSPARPSGDASAVPTAPVRRHKARVRGTAAKRRLPRVREPLSLETDPPPLLPMALGRAVFLWPASPRLRTGAWLAVHYFVEPRRTFRQFDPELVYRKADSFLVAQVGGAFRIGPVELSMAIPFVGLFNAAFYEGELVDRQARKVDRADLRIGLKYGLRFQRGRDLWLVTPYLALTAPTGKRESYQVSVAGHPVLHYTVPPRGVSVLPGLAAGWRRKLWSAVVSLGGLVTVPLESVDDTGVAGEESRLEVSLVTAYQFGFTPFRDLSVTLALLHVRELYRVEREKRDLFLAAPGLRLQPYLGLYGHLGVTAPLGRVSRRELPVMVTLQAGWEFR